MKSYCHRKLNWVATLCLFCVISVAPSYAQQSIQNTASSSKPGEKRIALVIGNADYKFAPRLDNPRNDARDMCASLNKLGFETMCYENQRTKREMKDAVIRFSEKLSTKTAVALVFYAGHGMQVKGENYLIPTEAELRTEADMEDETLNVNYLMAQLDHSKNSFNVVILDACRNNPLSRGWRSAGGRGLAPIDAPVGSIILFSTAPGKEAYDGIGRNGLFTKHLLANLTVPGLSLEEMIKQVSRGVMEESGKIGISQTPWWNSSFTGKFCFAGCSEPIQSNDLERIRREKEQLEAVAKRVQKESEDKQKLLTEQEVKARSKQEELEARIRQLEAESQKSSGQTKALEELAANKKQLDALQTERLKQEEAQRKQREEIKQLDARRKELELKAAEIEAMSQRLVELERDKAEKERLLEIERAQKRLWESQPPVPVKLKNIEIPPAL